MFFNLLFRPTLCEVCSPWSWSVVALQTRKINIIKDVMTDDDILKRIKLKKVLEVTINYLYSLHI